MGGLKINLHASLPKPKPLRVVHVATQAIPFVKKELGKGLSEVAGRMPAALNALGIDSSLVLPLFKTTQDMIQEEGHQLQDLLTMRIRFGPKRLEASVKTMLSPLEPSYQVYFIENAGFFGSDKMYGHPNDLERFAFFCRAVLNLQRKLDVSPDIIECHDWQTALIPVYLYRLVSGEAPLLPASDRFFSNTKSILAVHEFAYTGEFASPSWHEAGLGWEMQLPGIAEFYGRLNLLKAGLYRADRSYARTPGYIQSVIDGNYGQKDFAGIARERFETGKLVGLCPTDKTWGPDLELTPELALRGARHVIAIYRSVVNRPFLGMEYSEQTSPSVTFLALTAEEILEGTNKKAYELYQKLSASDTILIQQALAAGEAKRFAKVETEEDMKNILALLKIKPECSFEEQLRQEGLGEFLEAFYPWDLDRILSISIPSKKCTELLEQDPDLVSQEKITLHEAMKRYRYEDGSSLLDHIFGLFRSLKLFSSAVEKSDAELASELEEKGEFVGEEGLANATPEFRQFFEVYGLLARGENHNFFKAFLLAVLLHDLCKPIRHDTHAAEGANLFEKIKEVRGILNPEELDFAAKIIRHHSLFGDAFILWEQNTDDILEIFPLHQDRKLQDLAVKSLYLIGIADMNSVGERGKLSPYDISRVRNVYHAVLFSKTKEELSEKLDELGFGMASKGENRWKALVVGKPIREASKEERKKMRKNDIKIAAAVLEEHCLKKAEAENKDLVSKLRRVKNKKRKKRIRNQLNSLAKEEVRQYHRYLGEIEDILKMNVIKGRLDAESRARLLIWLIEFSKNRGFKNYSFELSRKAEKVKEEIKKLEALLHEFDLDKITQGLEFEYDSERDLLEISIKI